MLPWKFDLTAPMNDLSLVSLCITSRSLHFPKIAYSAGLWEPHVISINKALVKMRYHMRICSFSALMIKLSMSSHLTFGVKTEADIFCMTSRINFITKNRIKYLVLQQPCLANSPCPSENLLYFILLKCHLTSVSDPTFIAGACVGCFQDRVHPHVSPQSQQAGEE